MKKKLRIIVSTNSSHSISGYGSQAHDLLPRMQAAGYETACLAFYGIEGGDLYWKCRKDCCKGKWPEIKMYPRMGDVYGADALVPHSEDFKADVTFTLQDLWVMNPQPLQQLKRFIPIVPIDMEPVPQAVYDRLRSAYRIVTYAKFGQRELRKKGLYSTYIQHTVDTSIFKPEDKKATKKALGVPEDTFLFGMVGANKDNPPRKSFQEVMDAFRIFHERHPKSAIYFHTLLTQQGGFNIIDYAKFLDIESAIYHLPPYQQMFQVDRVGMSKIYNAFDVLMMPSTNGGFEVPIVEAMSCSVPVITNDFTAMSELVEDGKTGYKTKVAYKRFTPLGSYIGVPDVHDIYDKMEQLYKDDREKMGKAAREHAVENYDTDKIFNTKWLDLLQTIENEIYPPKP